MFGSGRGMLIIIAIVVFLFPCCFNSLQFALIPRVVAAAITLGSISIQPVPQPLAVPAPLQSSLQSLPSHSTQTQVRVRAGAKVQIKEYRYEDEEYNKELEREMKDKVAGSVLGSPGNR